MHECTQSFLKQFPNAHQADLAVARVALSETESMLADTRTALADMEARLRTSQEEGQALRGQVGLPCLCITHW